MTLLILLADLLWAGVAFFAAAAIRYGLHWGGEDRAKIAQLAPFLLATCFIWMFLSTMSHLDCFRGGWHFPAVVSHLVLAVTGLMGLLLATAYLFQEFVSRLVLSYFGALLLAGFIAIRYAARGALAAQYRSGAVSRVVIAGSGPVARELATKIERHPEMLCKVVGFLCPEEATEDDLTFVQGSPFAVSLSTIDIAEHLRDQKVNELILALSKPAWGEVLNLAGRCREYGINVSLVPQPYELYLSSPSFVDLDGLPVLRLREPQSSALQRYAKRAVDLSLGTIGAVLAAPLISVCAIVLRVRKGQAFRWETRCGLHGKSFSMLRLNVPRGVGIVHTTRFDRVLERLSITELPQLVNVLSGDMSLVGPRPEALERVRRYSDWQQERLSVKPGMTGLAQVHGLREQNASEEKARFDLQYRLNPSPVTDISLLLQTIWTLIMRVVRYSDLIAKDPGLQSEAERPTAGADARPELMEVLSRAHRPQPSTD
jgi:lipopolysaccharide/colanic/teichoic acid biosynthesis glycosyltransferase